MQLIPVLLRCELPNDRRPWALGRTRCRWLPSHWSGSGCWLTELGSRASAWPARPDSTSRPPAPTATTCSGSRACRRANPATAASAAARRVAFHRLVHDRGPRLPCHRSSTISGACSTAGTSPRSSTRTACAVHATSSSVRPPRRTLSVTRPPLLQAHEPPLQPPLRQPRGHRSN